MDTRLQVQEWIRKLGYDGDIPENLDKICNNSTYFIWDQLIQNARSRKEVENMRKNILVHRLKKNGVNLYKENKSQYPLLEINTYVKRRDLEENIAKINYEITEKQQVYQKLNQQNKMKRYSIEKENLKIKENEEREFLLREKLKLLENNLEDVENILCIPMNCNLVDHNKEVLTTEDIKHSLEECSEEAERSIKQIPLSQKKSSNDTINKLIFSTQKSVRKDNIFEQYFCLSEQKTTRKLKAHKENVAPTEIKKQLFAEDDRAKSKDVTERRASLEMYVENNDDENFLVDLNKASFLRPPPSSQFHTNLPLITIQDNNRTFLFSGPKNVVDHRTTNQTLLKTIFRADFLASDITRLLRKCSAQTIWNTFRLLDDDVHYRILEVINFKSIKLSSMKNLRRDDLARLQALHVKTEFKILKNKILLKHLIKEVNKKREVFNVSLMNSKYTSDTYSNLQKKLELQLEDVRLDCSRIQMNSEIGNFQTTIKMTDISQLKRSVSEVKDKIAAKTNYVLQYLEIIQEIFTAINLTRNKTSSCVSKLAPFISDLHWCSLLVEKVNAGEIKVFEKFSLERNRKFVNTNPSLYYKDMHTNKFLANREIDDQNLNMLTEILRDPFTGLETVILNILRGKLKLDCLKSIRPVRSEIDYKKHTLRDLQKREEYLSNVVEQFNALLFSSTSKKTLSAVNSANTIMEMWNEMLFKNCISPTRTVEGKNYKSYEKMFDMFYNNL